MPPFAPTKAGNRPECNAVAVTVSPTRWLITAECSSVQSRCLAAALIIITVTTSLPTYTLNKQLDAAKSGWVIIIIIKCEVDCVKYFFQKVGSAKLEKNKTVSPLPLVVCFKANVFIQVLRYLSLQFYFSFALKQFPGLTVLTVCQTCLGKSALCLRCSLKRIYSGIRRYSLTKALFWNASEFVLRSNMSMPSE